MILVGNSLKFGETLVAIMLEQMKHSLQIKFNIFEQSVVVEHSHLVCMFRFFFGRSNQVPKLTLVD